MSTSCEDSGCDGPTVRWRPWESLLRPTSYLPSGLTRVALGRRQVADRVGHRHLVHDLPGPELPLGDRAVHEQRGVGVAVGAELRVQRAEADRHLGVLDRLVLQHRDAVLVAGEVLVADRRLDLLPVEGGGDALELAGADDVLAVGRHVDPVRRLAAGHEVDEAGVLRGVDDLDSADHLRPRPSRRAAPPASSPPRRCSRGRFWVEVISSLPVAFSVLYEVKKTQPFEASLPASPRS